MFFQLFLVLLQSAIERLRKFECHSDTSKFMPVFAVANDLWIHDRDSLWE